MEQDVYLLRHNALNAPMRTAAFVSLALACVACGPKGDENSLAEHSAPIVSGEQSPSPMDDAVVFLRHGAGASEVICTATMVAPNLIVTARHCVAYVNGGAFQCTVRGEPISISDGGGILGPDVAAESIEIRAGEVPSAAPVAQGQEIVSTLSLTNCVNDLAFVVLDRSLELPVAGLRLGTKTAVGEAVTVLGYGVQQLGVGELDWPNRPRKKKHLTLAAVGPDRAEDATTLIPRTLVTNGPAACSGDSGGPLLSDKTGAVVGVYTNRIGSDDCANPSVVHYYTHLSPFETLALDAFARAHAEPIREKRGAFGDPCQNAADCEDAVCAPADDGGSRCSRICAASAPCPESYECRAPADFNGPNICVAKEALEAGVCVTCDAGGSAPPDASSSSGGCTFVACRSHASDAGGMIALLVGLALIRRRGSRRCRLPSNRWCRHTRIAS